jgi:Tol biopolymer transport system component
MNYRKILLCTLIMVMAALSGAAAQDDSTEIVFVTGQFSSDIAIATSDTIVSVMEKIVSIPDDISIYDLSTPQWSPDAMHIAFSDGRNIFIVDVDGSDLVQLTAYDDPLLPRIANISWSTDGKTIAATLYYDNSDDNNYWIRLIDVETTDEHDITSGDYSDGFYGISWSPNGDFIVFTSNREGFVSGATGLYVLNLETGSVSSLTDISSRVRFDRYPSWSPDGLQIAFVSENYDDGGWDIYLIDADGSNLQRLTNSENAPEVSGLIFGGTIDWSPDGDKIVFTACINPYPEGCELFTIDVDGQNLTQITDNEAYGAFDPNWKPRSDEIINDNE